jgi:chromosome partitioning protein
MILAVVNEKGGVAKTTTTINLGAGLADRGHRVLLIDLDGQASASLALGVPRAQLTPGTAEVIVEELDVREAIRPTNVKNLDLITGSRGLASADISLSTEIGRERRLQQALEPLKKKYRYILIDCGPALGLLTVNALVAADKYLIPVTPAYLSLEGTVNLEKTVRRIETGIGTCASMMGIVLTMVDRRTASAREIVEMVRQHYGKKVMATEIPMNVRLLEAPSFGKTIFQHDSKCPGSLAYGALAEEVLTITGAKSSGAKTHEKNRKGGGGHLRRGKGTVRPKAKAEGKAKVKAESKGKGQAGKDKGKTVKGKAKSASQAKNAGKGKVAKVKNAANSKGGKAKGPVKAKVSAAKGKGRAKVKVRRKAA